MLGAILVILTLIAGAAYVAKVGTGFTLLFIGAIVFMAYKRLPLIAFTVVFTLLLAGYTYIAPPAGVAPGGKFAVTDTVMNDGNATAAATTTRYYLSNDPSRDASDVLLTGTRAVTSLAGGASSSGSKTVTVPLAAPEGTYYLFACADDLLKVAEASEANNCLAAAAN
jgi:hypothetical protein